MTDMATDMAHIEGFIPVPPDLAEQYRRAGYWRGEPLGDHVARWAAQYADRTAIIDETTGTRINYHELAGHVDRLAYALLQQGFAPGDRVVVQLPNTVDFVLLVFAFFRIGVSPIMALPPHREYEITGMIEFGGATAYVAPATLGAFDFVGMARNIRQQYPQVTRLLFTGEAPATMEPGELSLRALLDETAPDAEMLRATLAAHRPDPSEIALFLLSGGTTGRPKLIPRTHDDYSYNFRVSAPIAGFDQETVYMAALPIAHNFPFGSPGMLGALEHGGSVVLAPSPDAETAFPLIERERVTATSLVPAAAIRWMDSPKRAEYDLSSLRVLQVGGARIAPEAARRVRPTFGCQLQQVFGMAEGLLNYTRLDDPDEVIIETQGRPASPADEIRIVDSFDRPVPAGEMGNLLTRGPYTIRGYFNASAANAEAFTADGFYRSGDVVRLHPSGSLVVEGREKDLINRGGEKISAEEVENLLLAHPAVAQVAVVAMPDPILGERTCAFVIPNPDMTLTLSDLTTMLAARGVAKFKWPERLELVEAFPLTSIGKVHKKALREHIAARIGAERGA
ncbi:MAG TPA: AMP-binding protein [Ktedonobacterales bacterium]|nr:AMP-binding protein [Ktedonobacterales bacterium]